MKLHEPIYVLGAEVGMIAVHHLGGPLGTSCVGLGNAKRWRRLNVGNHYPEVHIRELSLSLCNFANFHFTTLSLLPEVPTNEILQGGTTNQSTNDADLSQDILEGHCPEGRRGSGRHLAHLCRWRFRNLRLLQLPLAGLRVRQPPTCGRNFHQWRHPHLLLLHHRSSSSRDDCFHRTVFSRRCPQLDSTFHHQVQARAARIQC